MTESAFEQMAARLHRKAEDTSLAYGVGTMMAEDVAQDVMLKLWAMRDEIDGDNLEHLAAVMAKRLTMNAIRDSRTVELNAKAYLQEASIAGPAELLEEQENSEWLERRMEQLPEKQNIILRMRQVERRDSKEIAALLGIEVTSVSTLLARARKSLLSDIKKRNGR